MKNSTELEHKASREEDDEVEELDYTLRPNPRSELTLLLPDNVIASLTRVAAEQSTSVKALVARYIGEGLREDLSALYSRQILDMTANVLSRHLQSDDEVSSILKEIREEAAKYG